MTARTPYGRLLFAEEGDRAMYLELLADEVERSRWQVLSHCQMTNHVHLLIRTPQTNLGSGMKRMHERFANWVNRRRRQHGHVFGGRFSNRLVVSDRHLHGCLRYIARNPVEAGMCDSAADWPWSAHRQLLGLAADDGCVTAADTLGLLGETVGAGRIAYQQLLAPDTDSLLARWARSGSDEWLPAAVDALRITVEELAGVLGLHPASVRRRIARARHTP